MHPIPQDPARAAQPPLPTVPFSAWLAAHRRALRDGTGADVPCGDCRGCCASSYFIHIQPDEKETLAAIPKPLLFPAPGMPRGHVLMGHDEQGHCPMLKNGACSIYARRPRACRDYDCRVFAASGVAPEADKPAIARQAARWAFDLPGEEDRRGLDAARDAARFVERHAARFPAGFLPDLPTRRALVALAVHEVFLESGPGSGGDAEVTEKMAEVLAAWTRSRISGTSNL